MVQTFSKKWKIAIFLESFHFFYHFFKIIFHHFCFQWWKNLPKNGKLQFSSGFFIFLIIFFIFFNHVSSFLLPVVQKFVKKWRIAIFLVFFHFLIFFFIIFSSFFMFHHFCFQWCKNFPENGNCNFPRFFIFLIIFLIMFHHFCFQWCKNFPENGNCNFPRFFIFLIIFLIIFHHFCFQWCKHFPKNGKLQFSSCFPFFSLFYHVSSFLLPVVQKFSKKWKIAIFLGFFIFYHFSFF